MFPSSFFPHSFFPEVYWPDFDSVPMTDSTFIVGELRIEPLISGEVTIN